MSFRFLIFWKKNPNPDLPKLELKVIESFVEDRDDSPNYNSNYNSNYNPNYSYDKDSVEKDSNNNNDFEYNDEYHDINVIAFRRSLIRLNTNFEVHDNKKHSA